ncbi:MAG TPA: hypothetical protein VFA63_16310 [Pseudonocardiaceae bacterium]|nr:hypothetical protein [Pseudonocardiaceae bacterium]
MAGRRGGCSDLAAGLAGAIAAVMVLPHLPGGHAGRFDVLGFITVATGLFTLLLALSEGER